MNENAVTGMNQADSYLLWGVFDSYLLWGVLDSCLLQHFHSCLLWGVK
jgi:hypothetical protein